MRKLLSIVLLVIFLFSYEGVASAAYKTEYRLHTTVSENTSWGQAALLFCNKVREYTNGKVNIKPYWSSQLLAGKQASEVMFIRNGTIDFSYTAGNNLSSVITEFEIFHLPFFVSVATDKYKALDAIFNGRTGRLLEKAGVEKGGFKVLAWADNGFKQLHYTGNIGAIRKPEDMKNIRVRYVSAPIYRDSFMQMGANPMSMNWGDALQGFQQGLIDAGENSTSIIINYKIFEFHKQITDWSNVAAANVCLVNNRVWASFDNETKEQIQRAADFAAKWRTATIRLGMDEGKSKATLQEMGMFPPNPDIIPENPYQYLQSKGMKIYFLNHQEIEAFKNLMDPVYKKWIPRIGEEIYHAAMQDIIDSENK